MSESVLQWKRVCQVDVGRSSGEHLRVDQTFKIEFEVTKTIGRTPNTALIRLFNLSQEHENQVKGEFDDVVVNAGYEGDVLMLFRGNIRHTSAYRDGNDRIIEIDAADGDKDFHQAVVNTTLAPGSTTGHFVDAVVRSFSKTKKGHVQVAERTFIRGRVIAGMSREALDELAGINDANWSIQDGNVQIVRADSTLPTEAIVLRADTGLLEAPQVDDKGIKTKCLLNPRIAINGKVQLDNNDIKLTIKKQKESKPGAHKKSPKKKRAELARLDPDGVYKTYKIKHKGDTRGPDWFTEACHVGLDKAIPAGKQAA